MRFDAVIFDFDGTLVDSAAAKYEAFFALFPQTPAHRQVVANVLAADPDGSRHVVIPRMVERMRSEHLALPAGHSPEDRIAAYADVVLEAVAACAEIPGASTVLRELRAAECPVFISSNTPQEPLETLVQRRGWAALVAACYGYPNSKAATAQGLLSRLGITAGRLAVVGDGSSDRAAAEAVGAAFFPIVDRADLRNHAANWGLDYA